MSRNRALMAGLLVAGLALGGVAGFGISRSAGKRGGGGSSTSTASSESSGAQAASDHGGGQEKKNKHQKAHGKHSKLVRLEKGQMKKLNIKVAALDAGSARSVIKRPATVKWDLDRVARVGPRIKAKVEEVLVDLGDRVKKGDPVMVMSSVELGRAKAKFLTARARVASAKARLRTDRANYKRLRSLHEQKIASEAKMLESKAKKEEARAEVREAKAKVDAARETLRVLGMSKEAIQNIAAGGKEPLSFFRVRSPAAGVVQKRHVRIGQTIGANESPIHVVRTDRMWVMVNAYERDVPLLEKGKSVELTVRSLPGKTFHGKVDWISNKLDEKTRTLRLRAVVENPDGLLRAGMFGTAAFHTDADGGKAALAPPDAIQRIEGTPYVFVPGDEKGTFKPVKVTLGEDSKKWVEVLTGVKPGTKVVTQGAFNLKAAFTAKGRSAAHSH